MSIYDGKGNTVDVSVQWNNVQGKEDVDAAVSEMDSMSGAFIVKPVVYDPSKVMSYNGDGEYIAYPFAPTSDHASITFYDETGAFIHVYNTSGVPVEHGTTGAWSVQRRDKLIISGTTIKTETYISLVEWENNTPHATNTFTLSKIPTSVKTHRSYNIAFLSEVSSPYDLRWFYLNDAEFIGFTNQMTDAAHTDLLLRLTGSGDVAQRVKALSVREMNAAKSAIRIATYNIYGAGYAQRNWDALKKMLFDFSLDICACQEVKNPLNIEGTAGDRDWREAMTSWMLPYGSSNGELHPTNERVALSRLPILSSSEYEFSNWSSDKRCLAKDIIQLPRYQDRVGSEQLKLSLYNTQLEVYPTGQTYENNYPNSTAALNRIAEVNQILSDIANDPNPFIVVCMDSNDFSPDKETWAMFEAAGFTPAINILTQTVTAQDNCIDQIFVNSRMKVLSNNVINSKDYTWYDVLGGTLKPMSDHDLCYADVEFDYSGIFCIKQDLSSVTSDCTAVWGEMGDSLTINLTPETGKSFSKVEIRMGPNFVTKAYYSNGTLTIPEVTGDVYVIATAT